jgi:hypothetical protein
MIRRYAFPGFGSSGASSRCPPLHMTVNTIDLTLHPTNCQFIRCWRLCSQNLIVYFFETVGWTAAPPSVHPVLLLQYWCVCLVQTWSSDRPTVLSNGPSVHPTHLTSLFCLFYSPNACRMRIVGSSDGASWLDSSRSVPSTPTLAQTPTSRYRRFIRRSHFSSFSSTVWTLEKYTIFSFCHVIFLHPCELENVYKDMLNNIVSLIDHVVMNHQNHTRTNGIWGHVRYKIDPLLGKLWTYTHLGMKVVWVLSIYRPTERVKHSNDKDRIRNRVFNIHDYPYSISIQIFKVRFLRSKIWWI